MPCYVEAIVRSTYLIMKRGMEIEMKIKIPDLVSIFISNENFNRRTKNF